MISLLQRLNLFCYLVFLFFPLYWSNLSYFKPNNYLRLKLGLGLGLGIGLKTKMNYLGHELFRSNEMKVESESHGYMQN